MHAYTDFAFYKDSYGGTMVSEADFRPLSLRASALIDKITFQRATDTDAVKMAMCAAVEALHRPGEAGSIASENNDGYSVTYREKSAEEVTREAYAVIRSFLPPELTNRGCRE